MTRCFHPAVTTSKSVRTTIGTPLNGGIPVRSSAPTNLPSIKAKPSLTGRVYHRKNSALQRLFWGEWISFVFRLNSPPSAPVLLRPGDMQESPVAITRLLVRNSIDAQQDSLTYRFEVYADEELTQLVAFQPVQSSAKADSTFSMIIQNLEPLRFYWWRVRASDNREFSPWSATSSFFTRMPAVYSVPSQFSTISYAIVRCPGWRFRCRRARYLYRNAGLLPQTYRPDDVCRTGIHVSEKHRNSRQFHARVAGNNQWIYHGRYELSCRLSMVLNPSFKIITSKTRLTCMTISSAATIRIQSSGKTSLLTISLATSA